MPVHPIEYRYGSPEMRKIFEIENRYRLMLQVEAALAKAEAEVGLIPPEAAEAIDRTVREGKVSLERIVEFERQVRHETMAVVLALSEAVGPLGEYVHFGVTSNDILDTVMALQIKQAVKILRRKLAQLLLEVVRRGRETINLVALGRTHGIAALPIPFGFKFAVWSSILLRDLERLDSAADRAARGKISGAVGTMAGLGGKGRIIQERVMSMLGLKAAEISTQVVPRDSLAELIVTLALISSTLDLAANEVRNLQRTEIGEVEEPFDVSRQVGSSTMPHKRNPILSEKVCGLARVMRGIAVAALENIVLEHERDLTNSSVERIIIPEAFLLLDEQIDIMIRVVSGLKIHPEAMRANLERLRGLIMAERVMLELAARGMGRQRAHELIRQIAQRCISEGLDFAKALMDSPEVRSLLSPEEIERLLNPETYLGESFELAEAVFQKAETLANAILAESE